MRPSPGREWHSGRVGGRTTSEPVPDSGLEPEPGPRRRSAAGGEDDRRLAGYAEALAAGVERALPGWVLAAVASRLDETEVERRMADIERLGRAAADEVGGRVRDLLRLDIDEQWTNPLTLLRTAIRYPNEILREAGADPVVRDGHAVRFLPDDVYDLAPTSFADFGPDIHDLGISWGAAKAHVHLRRRREEEVA